MGVQYSCEHCGGYKVPAQWKIIFDHCAFEKQDDDTYDDLWNRSLSTLKEIEPVVGKILFSMSGVKCNPSLFLCNKHYTAIEPMFSEIPEDFGIESSYSDKGFHHK